MAISRDLAVAQDQLRRHAEEAPRHAALRREGRPSWGPNARPAALLPLGRCCSHVLGPPWRAVDRLVEQMEQLAKEVQEARDETRAEHAAAALALEQQKGAATVELEARSPTISP